jgi:hypothetical protein
MSAFKFYHLYYSINFEKHYKRRNGPVPGISHNSRQNSGTRKPKVMNEIRKSYDYEFKFVRMKRWCRLPHDFDDWDLCSFNKSSRSWKENSKRKNQWK